MYIIISVKPDWLNMYKYLKNLINLSNLKNIAQYISEQN